jgi:methylmalonyl-CoA/ethylmalonyl-CoA epimerase
MIKKINHVAIVVPDIAESRNFWVEALGMSVSRVDTVLEQDVTVAFLPVGESDIELLEPLSEESGVARYMQKRGPGIHHICLEVEDIEGMLLRLKNAGIPLIDETPKISHDGKKLAFVHPKGTGGVLVELYQLPQ